jgi:hypothetical protein
LAAAERRIDVSGLVSKFGDDTAPTKGDMKFAVTSGEPDFRTLVSQRRTPSAN